MNKHLSARPVRRNRFGNPWILSWIASLLVCGGMLAAAAPPESIATTKGELAIHAVQHASMVLKWDGKTIYVDPVGGSARYAAFPKADLILITHEHGDHFDAPTLSGIVQDNTVVMATATVRKQMNEKLGAQTQALANGQSKDIAGLTVEAIPAYNLTPERLKFHPKGIGNGYVLTLGGKRVYISGDTEDIPEMKALKNIDAAFVCMNLPYTMTVDQAAGAVKAFAPKIVYPYHSRGSDLSRFKKEVESAPGTQVRILAWYP